MGPIVDRSKEHLGVSDAMIIKLRRLLLQTVKAAQAGETPPGLHPSHYRVRPGRFKLANGEEIEKQARIFVASN